MKKFFSILMVLICVLNIMPVKAQDSGVIAWNAKDCDAYFQGSDSGNDWYFHNSGWAEYTVDIPSGGIYKMTITRHDLVGDAVFTVTADAGKAYGGWKKGDGNENITVSENVYLAEGARKIKFSTTKGGIVSGFVLELVKEETRIYKSVKQWVETPSGGDNGDRWYFYDNTSASYAFDVPFAGKYSVQLNYQGAPANEKSAVTYNGYRYECTPGKSADINTPKEIVRGITLPRGEAVITISGIGSCNVSAISLVLDERIEDIPAVHADNVSFWDISGNRCESILDKNAVSFAADVINNTDAGVPVMMVYAEYTKDGRLVSTKADSQIAPGNGGVRLNINLSERAEPQRGGIYRIFIMKNGTEPITDKIEECVPENEIYVSAAGSDDGAGTLAAPFRTPERAMREVRLLNADMDADINVHVAGGVYRLLNTLAFDENDGGSNGYRVNWIGDGAVFTGADIIGGWTKYSDNIYCADYKTDNPVRQLTVNGKSAVRAKSRDMIGISGFYDDGVIIEDSLYAAYKNQSDIQLHFSSGWKSYLMNVENISAENDASKFKISRYAIDTAKSKVQHHMYENHHVWIENAFEELDEPGEFYYDRAAKKIYYIPRDGEDMETARVHAAALETLVDLRGSDAYHKVKNITFEGFTFENAAWYQPAEHGLLNDQAQMIVADKTVTERSRYGAMVSTAGIMLNFAEGVVFENNLIRDMGAVGIGMYEGVYGCKFAQNTFCDIADSAMTVGTLYQVCEDTVYQGKNLVGNKRTKSNAGTNAYAEHAIDCNTNSMWSPPDGACWWQIDLDAAYEIDRIEIDSRTDNGKTGLQGDLKGVRILASNDEDFADYSVLGTISDSTETKGTTYVMPVTDGGRYRYVRMAKNSYTCLANVRIINESMPYAPIVQTCKNNEISDNYITRVGTVNYGAPAVQAYYTSGLSVKNNEIADVPYSGICVGWGWNQNKTSTTCHDNIVADNKISDCMQLCFDGGGIYTLGQQPGTVISGNYIYNQANHLSAIYLDSGSAEITVRGNVLEDVPVSVFVTGDTNACTVEDNYTTSVKYTNGSSDKETTRYDAPSVFVPGAMPGAAAAIADNAGIRTNAESIRKRAENEFACRDGRYVSQNAIDNREEIGYMNDSYFAQYWLGIYLDAAQKWTELSEGRFDGDVLEDCRNRISAIRAEMAENISDRQKILSLYRQFKEVENIIRNQQ